jgi:hypothetical protein
VTPSIRSYPHHLTIRCTATEDVDPAVDRSESMPKSFRRQGAVEECIGAAPGRELGLGASAGMQAGENRDANHEPGTHFEPRAPSYGRFYQFKDDLLHAGCH